MKQLASLDLVATSSRSARSGRLYRPRTCDEALAILHGTSSAPEIVAGGTDLAARYNEGLDPEGLLAIDRIGALARVEVLDGRLLVGSGVTHAVGSSHPLVVRHIPGFADAWRRISNVRVRFWATIGGNLMARRTRYEMSILLSALDAELVFLTRHGKVACKPADIWDGAVPERSLLLHIAIPLHPNRRFVYERSLRPIMTLALTLDDGGGRAVVATEWLRPFILNLASGTSAADTAAQTFAALPEDFKDVATGAWYLRHAGTALLTRQLRGFGYV